MKHFSDEDWVDYVQGAIAAAPLADLKRHLTECPECARLSRFWENVRDAARRESANNVPHHVVRAGKAIFDEWRWKYVLSAGAKLARPIFDSLLNPLPAGVRTVAQPPRRVLHRLGQWIVDLRVESETGDLVSVAGQVLKPGWQPDEAVKTRVFLLSRHTLLAETGANDFGEFQFTFRGTSEDPMIFIDLPGRPAIAVSLPKPGQPVRMKKDSGAKKRRNDPP